MSGPAPSSTRLLLVDDEPSLRRALAKILSADWSDITTVADGREAVAKLDAETFDVVLSDIRMPGMDGLKLLRAVRERDLDLPVIFLTGSPTLETAMEAMEYGAFRYLSKPVDASELRRVVQRAAYARRLAIARRAMVGEVQSGPIGDLAGLEAKFSSAIERMWLAMQPILSWKTRSVFAYEALLRTEEATLANPVSFVDAAERLGRTAALGRAVRKLVADQLISLPPSVSMFVNLHPSDLVDDELLSSDGVLTPFAAGVVLEVTERAALERVHGVLPAIARLRSLGYRIAIDDLGAGYAGLSSFALLEPEIVKVDMSLIRGIHDSPTRQKLFRSVASVCREMNTEIVAEGVEVAEERDCLTELGGDLYQGYLFARPGRGLPTPKL
ncbi:MAG TPA: EAL domain-containing protein [Polyangia bacterium]|nr:EAL domain-containing protein [Polyangia bacterium]